MTITERRQDLKNQLNIVKNAAAEIIINEFSKSSIESVKARVNINESIDDLIEIEYKETRAYIHTKEQPEFDIPKGSVHFDMAKAGILEHDSYLTILNAIERMEQDTLVYKKEDFKKYQENDEIRVIRKDGTYFDGFIATTTETSVLLDEACPFGDVTAIKYTDIKRIEKVLRSKK